MTLEEKLKELDDRVKWLEAFDWGNDDEHKPLPGNVDSAKKFLTEFFQAGGPRLFMVPFDGYIIAESTEYWFDIEFRPKGTEIWLCEDTMVSDYSPWLGSPTELAAYVLARIAAGKVKRS